MMDKFRAQRWVRLLQTPLHPERPRGSVHLTGCSERFGTKIITETIVRVDLSQRPFKYWTEGEEEESDFMTADTSVVLRPGNYS